jgi:hypothetical protein
MQTIFGYNVRTHNAKPQTLDVFQGLVAWPIFEESNNSRCLIMPGGSHVVSGVTGLYVTSCRDYSSVQQFEATEGVSTYCLVSEGLGSGSFSHYVDFLA